jgi:anaerobic magnesium-protoporphyrin IX monomethyl ester cyclase
MPYAPLATLYAAALLRENGYEVKLHDIQFAASPKEITTSLNTFQPHVFVIYDDAFNYLSKMCLTNMRDAAFEMMQMAKKQGCKIIVSSSDATDHAEDYLDKGADAVIIGEAEHTLLEIVNAYSGKTKAELKAIQGLIFKLDHQITKTPPRLVIKDLDQLPLPAWDLIDIQPYKDMWLKHHGYFSINFVTTRGCPYKCNWCAKPIYGNRYNSHSPERIVDLIINLQKQFGFTHIWFADDIFGLKPNWLKDFAQFCKEKKVKLRYKIQSRADLLLEEDTISYLAQSGCDTVWMGAESGSQKILDAMDKGTKVEQIYSATRLLKQHHIKVAFFLQLGYLSETISDLKLTLKMVEDLLPDDLGISVSYPLPGTKFYDTVKSQLKQKSNWTDSDDLDLMFKSSYKSEFYKQLQRYIHHQYRYWKGIEAASSLLKNSSRHSWKRTIALPKERFKISLHKKRLLQLESDASKLF